MLPAKLLVISLQFIVFLILLTTSYPLPTILAATSLDDINQKVCDRFESDVSKLAAIMEEVERLMREEHLEKSAALRKLLHLGVQNYRLERALRGLGEGRFSLLKAADEAGFTVWEILDEAARRRVTWVAEDVMDDVRGRKGR